MKEKEKSGRLKTIKKKPDPIMPESLDADLGDEKQSIAEEPAGPDNLDNAETRQAIMQPSLTSELNEARSRASAKFSVIHAAVFVSLIVGLSAGVVGSLFVAPWLSARLGIGQGRAGGQEIKKVVLDENSAVIDVVKQVNPAVVSIVVTKDLPKIQQYLYDPFTGQIPEFFQHNNSGNAGGSNSETVKRQIGAGSGFIATKSGLIITNKHVVADDKADYTVITSDGKKYTAKVLAKDPTNDLAIVKIEAENLPTVELGDSGKIQLGQGVIAIGNTLGELSNTVTTGIVSGLSRTVSAGDSAGLTEQLSGVIQTDAAINPGNSGGPLLNLAGQVIGVNTAIDLSGQLVGFAIPVSEAKKVLDDVQQFGRVMRPFVGVRYVMLNSDNAKTYNAAANYGALLLKGENKDEPAIVPDSPAEKAGLKENDVILEVNGKKVDENNPLNKVVRPFKPGEQVVLKIQRGKDTKEILLTLGEAK